jgi:phosphoglycerate dehydrogenase-like enzyme
MPRMSILIIESFADQFVSIIAKEYPDLEIRTALDTEEARGKIAEVDALFGFGPSFDDDLIRRAVKLRWLHFLSTGTDALARLPSLRADVTVTNSYGVHDATVPEMTFMHMLVMARNYRTILRNQDAARWVEFDQPLLSGKTLTILGTGLIAEGLARRARAFGMHVVGVSSTPRELPNFDRVVHRTAFKAAAAEADFLVALAPLTPETTGIVNAEILGAMKPTAYLVNVGRGKLCDEAALIAALESKQIAGAGLDAFAVEPLPPDHPLWGMENVMITPHIAGRSDCYSELISPIFLHNIGCFLENRSSAMKNVKSR